MISIIIQNIGTTVARNVRLEFDPPLASTLDRESQPTRMTDWIALRDGIPTLVPGQRMGMLFDSLISRYADIENSPLPRQSRVTVHYTGDITKRQRGEVYTYAYDLDFNVYYGAHYVGRKGIDDIAKSLDQIRKAQEAWSTSHGIKVYTKDYDDHVDEITERRKQSIAKHEEMVQHLENEKQRASKEEDAPEHVKADESTPKNG